MKTRFIPTMLLVLCFAISFYYPADAQSSEPSPVQPKTSLQSKMAFIALGGNDTLSVLDTRNNRIIRSGIPVGRYPVEMDFSPDGQRLYVANNKGNSVSVINTITYQTIATIPVGSDPRGLAVSNNGQRIYVANNSSNSVSVISAETLRVIETIALSAHPEILAISPDGKRLVVPANTPSSGFVIDTSTDTIVGNFNVGYGYDVVFDPSGSRAYVSSGAVGSEEAGSVSVLDTASYSVVKTIPVGVGPHRLAIHPNGKRVYVANYNSFSISVIDTTSCTVVATISVDNVPWAMDLTTDGSRLYVPTSAGKVVVVDTTTNAVLQQVLTGSEATAVAVLHNSAAFWSISGRVTNDQYQPMPGVTISTQSGLYATTDANGYYILTIVPKGKYKLTPKLAGFAFVPRTRKVSVPPNARADFIGLQRPKGYWPIQSRLNPDIPIYDLIGIQRMPLVMR